MNVNIENTTSKRCIYYFIYYFVYGNIGHILLHSHVVNQRLVAFAISNIYSQNNLCH
jgi:hypothetical protein